MIHIVRIAARRLMPLALVFCFASSDANAAPIGVLSYDVLVSPSDDAPGVNVISVLNLTGGVAAPDFPVLDALIFQAATVTATFADLTTSLFSLGDLGMLDFVSVEVPDSASILSLVFRATLAPGTFTVCSDGCAGTTTMESDPQIIATLAAANGQPLTPGVDTFVIIEAQPVPEPSSLALIALAPLLAAGRSLFARRRMTDAVA